MSRLTLVVAVLSLFACGAPESTTTTTSSSQTCTQRFECIGGACRCTAGPKDGSSCCDPQSTSCSAAEKCDAFCRYCQ